MQTINQLLQHVENFDPDDDTLSSGERAFARIVTVLIDEWDSLDATQQRTLVAALAESARDSEQASLLLRQALSRPKGDRYPQSRRPHSG